MLSKTLYPVIVDTGQVTHKQAKVMLATDGRAVVWVARNGGIEKVAEQSDAVIKPLGGKRWTVTGSAGEWSCSKDGGCGCGHPLKRLDPKKAFE